MRIEVMFHPLDRSKLERWARTYEFSYKINNMRLADGYSVAAFEAPNTNPMAFMRRMAEFGIRVFTTPGKVVTPCDPGALLSGMGRLGEKLKKAGYGVSVRQIKKKGRPGEELALKKRARKLRDMDFYW